MNNVVFSRNSDNWRTPSQLYDFIVHRQGYTDLFEYCSKYDQYEKKDYRLDRLFINPPYSHINSHKFKDYVDLLLAQGNCILLLIPSRTDTRIFHHLLDYCSILTFFKGRLKFNDTGVAPFPSCLMFLTGFKCCPTFVQYCTIEDYIKNGSTNTKD